MCLLSLLVDGRDGFESGYSNSGGDLDEEEEEELEGDSSGSEAEEDDDEDEGEEKEEEDDDDEEEKERAEAAAAPMELDDDTDLHNIKLLIPDVKDCFITTDYSSNAVAKALGTLDFSDILALCKSPQPASLLPLCLDVVLVHLQPESDLTRCLAACLRACRQGRRVLARRVALEGQRAAG